MHISEVRIYNYKNYRDTKVKFSEGLNVVVGPNNSGKSNLLECVGYISKKPESNVDQFNKYVLNCNFKEFKKASPEIEIDYTIEHEFSYNSEDSAFSKLNSIIIYDKDANLQELDSGNLKINAKVKLKYELDKTYLNDYLIEMKDITCYKEFFDVLKRYEKKYSWNYYNVLTDEVVQDKEVNDIFEVDAIPANRIIDDIEERSKSYVNSKIKENERKLYLSEFSYFDGEYEIVFNIIDVDFDRKTITVAITRCGKITQDTFDLIRDNNGSLYFEYGMLYENKISIDDFEEVL